MSVLTGPHSIVRREAEEETAVGESEGLELTLGMKPTDGRTGTGR